MAARRAGIQPKKSPTAAVMATPSATDHTSTDEGTGVSDEMMVGVVSLPHGWGHNLEGARQRVAVKHPGVNANAIIDELDLDEPSASTVLNGVKVQVVTIAATVGSA